jgi:hypothetical protein
MMLGLGVALGGGGEDMNRKTIVGLVVIGLMAVVFAGGTVLATWNNDKEDITEYKEYTEIRGNTCAKEVYFNKLCGFAVGTDKLKSCNGDFYKGYATVYCYYATCSTTLKLNWETNEGTVVSTTCKAKDGALQEGTTTQPIKQSELSDPITATCKTKVC